jgi:tripartite-type tricarboxylate transporter receptor subunit TctC/DNA-binding CsgD family transcriptional regulator
MELVRKALLFLTAFVLPIAPASAGDNHPSLDKLTLIVPSVTGSGWDQLARAMERTLKEGGVVREIEVLNIPGDGGLKGLAEFIDSRRGDGHALLMGGVTMIRSARTSHSPTSLSQTIPVARLTGEFQVIAVPGGPGGTDVRSLDDLAEAYLANPKRLTRMPAVPGRGIDPALVNWRGVFAAPGITAEQKDMLSEVVERMAKTPLWHTELDRGHWADLYLPGPAFSEFVASQANQQASQPAPERQQPAVVWRTQMWLLHNAYWLALLAAVAVMITAGFMLRQRRAARQREKELAGRVLPGPESVQPDSARTQAMLPEFSDQIDRKFGEWGLTAAERDVALLILKGLRHKEIADLRGTSERTVRQQATMMYKKAGISGRTDLAAFFLFDS